LIHLIIKPRVLALFGIISVMFISGCGVIPIRTELKDVQEMMDSRTGLRVHWNQGKTEDKEVAKAIQIALAEKLTANEAVQIALLNNSSLQATYEELGIAQADLVQAGLLSNPVFEASVRFPDNSESTNTEFAVTQNFIDVFFLPLRKRLARKQLEKAKLHVGDAVLSLARDVRLAYYTLQGAEQTLAMDRDFVKAAKAASKFADRQFEAGNVSGLDRAQREVSYHEASLDMSRNETQRLIDRENLSRLMGLSAEEENWEIVASLPRMSKSEPSLTELVDIAMSNRLDLAAARKEIEIRKRALTLERLGIIPDIGVGINTEREVDGFQVTGPTFESEVPIFDQNQAQMARSKAMFRQSKNQLASLERAVYSDVEKAYRQVLLARKMVDRYRDTIIPLHEKVGVFAQKEYNFMLKGVYFLLQAKQEELVARRNSIEALRDYWIARSDLERSIGTQLEVIKVDLQQSTQLIKQPTSPHQHNHGGGSK